MSNEAQRLGLWGKIPRIFGGLLILILGGVVAYAQSDREFMVVGHFSVAQPGTTFPDGWKPQIFPKISRYTVYSLVHDSQEDLVVVQAVSEAGASGVIKEVKIDPYEYPIVQWQWKVSNVLRKGDVSRKEGDDYPARIYIAFEYDSSRVGLLDKAKYEAVRLWSGQYPPLAAINYIWESKAPLGTMVPNPYAPKEVIMFVIQSGEEHLNTWMSEQRNVYEDYKKAFGQEPPMISGVAIMTDTDNTGESATAYFGDITFRKSF